MTGPQHVTIISAGVAATGWILHPLLSIAGIVALAGVAVMWRNQRSGSTGLVNRWSDRSRRNQGVASPWAILRVSSAWAARRKARILRPSLAGLSWLGRWRTPIRELATPLARVGWQRIWSPVEDVTLRVGGPRTGKSGEMACRILDAPGAVIATSTRTDLVEHTARLRSRIGPTYVFNPSRVGNVPSTITFSPLSGCEDPAVAAARATDLLAGLPAPSSGDGEFWLTAARRALTPLLHAAALGDLTMWDVQGWLVNPYSASDEVLRLLSKSPEPVLGQDVMQFFSLSDRAQSSTTATILPALEWLSDTGAAAVAQKGAFDVEELLEQRGTVYLLGAEDARTAPLITALTGHIAREARRLAALQPQGRLDPPLTMCLDEAALICPIPLDKWTADMGGRNITIHIAAQSRAQLRQRWGQDGAAAILNNAATLLIFGGTRDPDDLAAYCSLSGERHEPARDPQGRVLPGETRKVPVLSAAQIAQLPAKHAVVIRRGMPPAVGRPQMVWDRNDVREARRGAAPLLKLWQAARAHLQARPVASDKPEVPRLRVVPPPEQDVA